MTYEGWKNYETWNLMLWINNDQSAQEYWEEQTREILQRAIDGKKRNVKTAAAWALAEMLEAAINENMPELPGFYSDVLNAALQAIDYRVIAESLITAAEELKGVEQ